MNHKTIYDSRDIRCKKPYGAVPSGTAVQFTLRPPHEAGFTRAQLTASFEAWHETVVIREMPLVSSEQGVDQFRSELNTGDYVGLVWYSFRRPSTYGKPVR